MPVSMTIRNVPDDVRDELAARAKRSGQSLQQYMRSEVIELAGKPTMEEWLEEVHADKAASRVRLSVDEILADRDADRP